jgi:hypothetical protein
MRVPRKKDSIAAMVLLFVSAILVPDPLAANNADNKETFSHGREKLPKLLPPSHKLGELETSPQLPSPLFVPFALEGS